MYGQVVEDDIVTDAVMVCKPCKAQQYPNVPELHSGHQKNVMRLVCLSLADKENEHCIRRIHESLGRCMPCRTPGCTHGWKVTDFSDGSGFFAERTCVVGTQVKWSSPAMIDHHEVRLSYCGYRCESHCVTRVCMCSPR
jgi:hypothetical protein|eukprot:COSAG06_NODE_5620_length_3356_cov_1.601474_4_plen_139_part_00